MTITRAMTCDYRRVQFRQSADGRRVPVSKHRRPHHRGDGRLADRLLSVLPASARRRPDGRTRPTASPGLSAAAAPGVAARAEQRCRATSPQRRPAADRRLESRHIAHSALAFRRTETRATDLPPTQRVRIGGFNRGKGAMPPPNLAPNKFQERPSVASRMQENLLAAGASPWTSPGELTTLPGPPSWWRGG